MFEQGWEIVELGATSPFSRRIRLLCHAFLLIILCEEQSVDCKVRS